MHAEVVKIDVDEVMEAGPLQPLKAMTVTMYTFVVIGVVAFFVGLLTAGSDPERLRVLWGSYYVNVVFWMGLAVGGVMITAIFQIVRATWSAPVRRIAEANIAFLPWAYLLFLATYLGSEHLFPWAREPMIGREWWMHKNFVYIRFTILFAVFFALLLRYVCISLRGDLGMARDNTSDKDRWRGWMYLKLSEGWQGVDAEVPKLQRKLSWYAPVLVVLYVSVYTLFATEMMVGMDVIWFSNMFGGFQFLGNLYIAWAFTALMAIYLCKNYPSYDNNFGTRQLWDLGMLTFGFCMLWGYTFFSQFLPQWYGNMPEETQWLMVRTRELPWKNLGWITFSMSFVIPFIMLLSEDIKKAPKVLSAVCGMVLLGVWLEKYMVIVPQLSPDHIPLGLIDVCLFLGFFGIYVLSVQGFLRRYPFIPISHPLTKGSTDW